MDKSFITLAVCILSIIICIINLLLTKKRIDQISVLPSEIISSQDKEINIENLTKSIYVSSGLLVVSSINIILPDGLLKFVIPIITIVVCGFLLSSVMEEVDALDVKKDDIDILMESNKKKNDEFKLVKEQMQNEKKKRREAKAKEK